MLGVIQLQGALTLLVSLHILIISASNYLVQLPVQLFGYHTTWGAFSFPFVYLATDLTVRIFGQQQARKIIFFSMFPALVISYVIGVLFQQGQLQSWSSLLSLNHFVVRIAFASFSAYCVGQLLDIFVFAKLRKLSNWWLAPTASSIIGNSLDSLVFFSVAFYASSDLFMREHWLEIASIDYAFKLLISLSLFIPAYGVLLTYIQNKLTGRNILTLDS